MTVPAYPLAVAWAAGVIDGEGCITITRQAPGTDGRVNPSHRLYLKVSMGHYETIRRLQSIFQRGAITRQPGGQWNDAWVWWVAQRQAGEVLHEVRPHLVTKAAEADLALEFLAIPRHTQGGPGGTRPLAPETVAARETMFARLRDAKPSARFRQPTC